MPTIAVLEDDQRRITSIRAEAKHRFAGYELRIFISARQMIEWLTDSPDDVRLLSLDCDLDSTLLEDNDCGSGQDVAAYLACNLPGCPVLIHSSNALRAPAMHMELALAGCKRVKLCPFQDAESWATDVRAQLDAC